MKLLLLSFAVLSLMSCYSTSIDKDQSTHKIKAMSLNANASGYRNSYILTVDTFYTVGDTISLPGYTFPVVIVADEAPVKIPVNYRPVNPQDYQLNIVEDTIIVFDGNRCVGKLHLGNDQLSKLILADNE